MSGPTPTTINHHFSSSPKVAVSLGLCFSDCESRTHSFAKGYRLFMYLATYAIYCLILRVVSWPCFCIDPGPQGAIRHPCFQECLKAWVNWARAQDLSRNGASSRLRLSLNKIMIQIILTIKCYFWSYSPKNWEFWSICQLATCDDRHPGIGLGLLPYTTYTIITHSLKRRQSVEPVCAIVSHIHLFVSGYCLYEYLKTYVMYCLLLCVIVGAYFCVGHQDFKKA
ncbi:hypothetical protein TNCV_835481 [Trichonephila clavipes]|nr:hypothetical protein TNCV_835481 [Trichonephila clavipes]